MYPDHVMMEIERRLCDTNHEQRNIVTIAEDIGFSDDTDMTIPDDGMEVAAKLNPIGPVGHVHRGVIQFPIVVSALDQTHRRLARLVYAINLRTHVDKDTGEETRELNAAVSQVEVLTLDAQGDCFFWNHLHDEVLPLATLRVLDARMVEEAIAAEQAGSGKVQP